MNARQLLKDLYAELSCEGYEPGSITDCCLGMIYDAVGDDIPFNKTRAEDLEAWHDLAKPSEKPATTAAQKRAMDTVNAKHKAYMEARKPKFMVIRQKWISHARWGLSGEVSYTIHKDMEARNAYIDREYSKRDAFDVPDEYDNHSGNGEEFQVEESAYLAANAPGVLGCHFYGRCSV